MLTQVKQGPVFDSQYNSKGRFSTTHSGKNHWTDNKTWYIELYIGGHLACKLWLQSGDVMGGLGEWPINQSINQSINQERIRVTKVTNVTARPLWSLPLSFLSVFFSFFSLPMPRPQVALWVASGPMRAQNTLFYPRKEVPFGGPNDVFLNFSFKNAPTLASCSFDKHWLILTILHQ